MKTLIAIVTAGSVLSFGAQRAMAHDGWATAGAVIAGAAVGATVASAFAPPPPTVVYTTPPVTYAAPPVAYSAPAVAGPVYVQPAPAPVVVYSAPAPYYAY